VVSELICHSYGDLRLLLLNGGLLGLVAAWLRFAKLVVLHDDGAM
jgi:hypothetical protein